MRLTALRSLRLKVFLLSVLALAPAVALSVAEAGVQREEALGRAHEETARLARLAAVAQVQVLDGSRQALSGLGWLLYLDPSEQGLCVTALRHALGTSPQFGGLGVVNPDGTVRCSTNPVPPDWSLANTSSFQRALATGAFAVGDYTVNRVTGQPALGLMLPVRNDTVLLGFVGGSVDLAWLGGQLAVDLPPGYTLALWDRQGTILARQPDHDRWVGERYEPATLATLQAHTGGTVELPGLDEERRVFGVMALGDGPAAYLTVGAPVRAALAPVEGAFQRDLLVLAAVATLAFVLAWVASDRWVLAPLRALDAAARRLAAGDLAARSGLAQHEDEVGQVARTFDHMAASLQDMRQREHRARLDLEAANARLADLNRLRQDFVNQAAHELGNPLAPIALQATLLRNGQRGPLTEDQRRSLDVIERNVVRLARLSQDVLDAARLQAGRLDVEARPVDLSSLVRDLVESQRDLADASGIALEHAEEPGLEVEADPHRVAQVLDNFLANALKFTPPGGRVEVRAALEHGEAVVRVRDTGVGFEAAEAERLFRPFSRLVNPGMPPAAGTGLGLYVSKGIVDQHRGRIWARSEGPRRGAEFGFALALRGSGTPAPGPDPPPPPARD